MIRERRISPRHDDEIEGKLEDHWRCRGAENGTGQRDLPAPTPREIENYEESYRRIDERADAHASRGEVRVSLPHLQPIDMRGDNDGVERQHPDRDHESGDGGAWPRDRERSSQPPSGISKAAGNREQHDRQKNTLAAAVGNPVGGRVWRSFRDPRSHRGRFTRFASARAQTYGTCSGLPLRLVAAKSSSWSSLIDLYISRDAPLRLLTFCPPRLAASAAPAARCCAFDFAGIAVVLESRSCPANAGTGDRFYLSSQIVARSWLT